MYNLIMDLTGLGWVWDAVDGYKTYIAAALAIVTGFSGLANEFVPLLLAHNAGGIFAFVRGLPHDPSWLHLIGGLGVLGLGHKLDKAAARAAGPATPERIQQAMDVARAVLAFPIPAAPAVVAPSAPPAAAPSSPAPPAPPAAPPATSAPSPQATGVNPSAPVGPAQSFHVDGPKIGQVKA